MNKFGFEEVFSLGDSLFEELTVEEQSQLRGGASMAGCGNGDNGCSNGDGGCAKGGGCSKGGASRPPILGGPTERMFSAW